MRAEGDSIRCSACGFICSADAWQALPVVRTLTHADVSAYVVAWPSSVRVEVRGCGGCGRSIARTTRPTNVRSASR
jgi:hypothetical protein